ncbi:MAG TPA: DNA topoisomerase IB [Burkholderiaceae bacterium]|jgi:DNA topoisomerase-1
MDSTRNLVYVSDEMPGLQRIRKGRGFAYRASNGVWLRDNGEIQRIRKLAIPPAYRDVWICPLPNGHLQATGRDARGRKQYRYHPLWREARESDKFGRLTEFGESLPRLRTRVAKDLEESGLSRTKLLATLVRLLDTTLLRVGNDEYARSNGSYGLTTLRNSHVQISAGSLRLKFRGKSGVPHDISVEDPRVARIVRRCRDLPGQDLFQYEDGAGVHGIGSADVNSYLAEVCGSGFTAKDFRTWHGSARALELTQLACKKDPEAFNAKAVLTEVAESLRNTPAVCRKSYLHPAILALWAELSDKASATAARHKLALLVRVRAKSGLKISEQRLLQYLQP